MINYYSTALEDWVTDWYIRNRIRTPRQIMDLKHIALKHEIFLKQSNMAANSSIVGRFKGISIDNRETVEIQREQFFHELCHILRHCGHQSMMPEAFRELQERDANHFTLYAAMPAHMIRRYDLSDELIIDVIAEDFKVRRELTFERLERIHRNQKSYVSTSSVELGYL